MDVPKLQSVSWSWNIAAGSQVRRGNLESDLLLKPFDNPSSKHWPNLCEFWPQLIEAWLVCGKGWQSWFWILPGEALKKARKGDVWWLFWTNGWTPPSGSDISSSLLTTIKFFPIRRRIGLEADGLAESVSARPKTLTPEFGESLKGTEPARGLMTGRITFLGPEFAQLIGGATSGLPSKFAGLRLELKSICFPLAGTEIEAILRRFNSWESWKFKATPRENLSFLWQQHGWSFLKGEPFSI